MYCACGEKKNFIQNEDKDGKEWREYYCPVCDKEKAKEWEEILALFF